MALAMAGASVWPPGATSPTVSPTVRRGGLIRPVFFIVGFRKTGRPPAAAHAAWGSAAAARAAATNRPKPRRFMQSEEFVLEVQGEGTSAAVRHAWVPAGAHHL